MVDLAYWSDFDTSRRDAASAFATLSMNGEHTAFKTMTCWGFKPVGKTTYLARLAKADDCEAGGMKKYDISYGVVFSPSGSGYHSERGTFIQENTLSIFLQYTQ